MGAEFMKKLLILSSIIALSGCSALVGKTSYKVSPFVTESGEVICCEATVFNSKDYETLNFKLTIAADGSVSAELDEVGVSASDPNAVQAENNGKLLDAVSKLIPSN